MKLILFTAFAIFTLALFAQRITDPQIIREQNIQHKKAEEAGYGDIEIDLLHKKIKETLPKLIKSEYFEKKDDYLFEENGIIKFALPIASGESIKSISKRYLFSGEAIFYTNKEGTSLDTVLFSFRRLNPLGTVYKEEKREIENPTPNFSNDGKKIDRNDDLRLVYYETKEPKEGKVGEGDSVQIELEFFQKYDIELKKIQSFERKALLVSTYKKYLRRAARMLDKKMYDVNLKARHRLREMLELK